MRVRALPLSILFCLLSLPLPTVLSQTPKVTVASRDHGTNSRSLLITIPEARFSGIDEIRLRIPKEAVNKAESRLLPDGWKLLKRGSELSVSGQTVPSSPLRVRLDVGSGGPLKKLKLFLGAGGRKILERRISVEALPKAEVARSLEGLLLFPNVASNGDRVKLGVLDPDRTPSDGHWTIEGETVETHGERLIWTVPDQLRDGAQPRVTYSDAWDELLLDASPSQGIQMREPHRQEGAAPRITGCVSQIVSGGQAAVCGYFPPRVRSGLTLDGRPAGEPLASSQQVVVLRIAPEILPGVHVIAGDPELGFSPSDQVLITVLRVHASIDREQLTQNQSTQVHFRVEGTGEVVEFELTNQNPELVALQGGDSQIATTTGGRSNSLIRKLRKVAWVPGRERDFGLSYAIRNQERPCSREPRVSHHPDGYWNARVLAAIPAAAVAAMNTVAQALAATLGLNLIDVHLLNSSNLGLITFQIQDARPVPVVLALLQADPRVTFAQPDYLYETSGQSSSSFNDPYARLSYGSSLIRANRVHPIATGRAVPVAVVDTGIDRDHVELKGRLALYKDFTGMGFNADIHGTQVAGIIAAEPDNGIGISGVAPGARLIALKACQPYSAQAIRAQCWSSALAKAIDFSLEHDARVLNLSVGGRREDKILTRQVDVAASRGGIVVAAAGNEGPRGDPSYPAALASVMAVTAVDVRRSLYTHATQGAFVDLAAPGVDIVSTAPRGQFPVCSGTSFATAFVTGVVALLLERSPELTPGQVQEILEASASDLGHLGKDPQFGSGLVDACEAVNRALGDRKICQ